MLRFSANLGFLWPDRPLLARIDAAARAGFQAIEVHWPYDVPAEDVRRRCQHHGLVALALNTRPGDLDAGEFGLGAVSGREADFAALVDQSIAYCRAAGFSAIHLMAGRVPAERRAEAKTLFAENVAAAAAKAEAHGLTVLLEPLNPRDAPGYLYSTVEEAAEIVTRVSRSM